MPRTDLEQLVYSVDARIDKLTKAMDKAAAKANSGSNVIEGRFKTMKDRVEKSVGNMNVGKALDKVFDRSRLAVFDAGAARVPVFGAAIEHLGGVGIAAAIGIGALAGAVMQARAAMDMADELSDAATKINVNVVKLQEYRFAVRAAGGEVTDADDALKKFNLSFRAAQEGYKKPLKAFGLLGFTQEDLRRAKSIEDLLPRIADKVKALGAQGQAADILEKLGLTGLKPVLEQGSAAMEESMKTASRLGAVMSEELIKKAGDAHDRLEVLSQVIDVQLKSAFVGLSDPIVNATTEVAKLVTELAKLANDPTFQRLITKGVGAQIGAIKGAKWGLTGMIAGAIKGSNEADLVPDATTAGIRDALTPKPKEGLPPELPDPAAGEKARAKAARSQQLIDDAIRSEISARSGLTDNIEVLADLRKKEIDADLKRKVDGIKADAAADRIDKAAGERAITIEELAADEKKQLVDRQTEERLEQQRLDERRVIGETYDAIDQINISLLRTTAERYEAEKRLLAIQQRRELEELRSEMDRRVGRGELTRSAADGRIASVVDRQAADSKRLFADSADAYKQSILGAFEAAKGGAKSLANYFGDALKAKLLDNLADSLSKMLLNSASGGGSTGKMFADFGKLLGFAGGGDPPVGKPYLVGENGPEIRIDRAPSTILPNTMLRAIGSMPTARSAAPVVHQYVTINAEGSILSTEVFASIERAKQEATVMGANAGSAAALSAISRTARNRLR